MLAFLVLCLIFAFFGLVLSFFSIKLKPEGDPLADKIDALLPQIQCAQCNYPGCRPYAEAIAKGEADIYQCPPGGEAGVKALADLLGLEVKPLNSGMGKDQPKRVALIEEEKCIGCTLCIQACPVDAILGAPKLMHTVIASECTGCDLCLPPCPVDCITMEPAEELLADWRWPEPAVEKH